MPAPKTTRAGQDIARGRWQRGRATCRRCCRPSYGLPFVADRITGVAERYAADVTNEIGFLCKKTMFAFGGKDHTTVLHACRKISSLREESYDIKDDYQNLIRTLSS